MKTPRITDFDPDAKAPTLKSSMDNMPPIAKPKQHSSRSNTLSTVYSGAPGAPQGHAAPFHSSPLATKRVFLRRTFDFYDDQISFLKQESLQQRLAGKEIGMNEMVREALDDWIRKRNTVK